MRCPSADSRYATNARACGALRESSVTPTGYGVSAANRPGSATACTRAFRAGVTSLLYTTAASA